jgi:hypothetical protein
MRQLFLTYVCFLCFFGRDFCADSEYMLDVANGPTLALAKKAKNPFFAKIPKMWKKNPTQKNNFFFYLTK